MEKTVKSIVMEGYRREEIYMSVGLRRVRHCDYPLRHERLQRE